MKVEARNLIWIVLFLAIIPLIYFGMKQYESEEPTESKYNFVVGYYICGEGFSNAIVDNDISDTLGLGNELVEFVYLVDYDGFGNTEFFTGSNYSREYINISEILPYDSTELDLGSGSVLQAFVEYLYTLSSDHYCLMLWGHGRGDEGVCFDHGSSLSSSEIRDAIRPKKLDCLVFDACEMLSLEVLNDLVDVADLVLGSEKDIPDRGLDYASGFLGYLHGEGNAPLDLLKHLLRSSYDYYQVNPSRFSLQLSIVNMPELALFIDELRQHDPITLADLPSPFESGKRYDLGLILEQNGYPDLKARLDNTIEDQVLLHPSEGVDIRGVSGISVLDPILHRNDEFYSTLPFIRE